MSDRVDRILMLTRQLFELDKHRAEVLQQIELLVEPQSKSAVLTAHFLPSPVQAIPAKEVVAQGEDNLPVAPPQGQGVAQYGFSREVFEFLKAHPDREFSPEEIAGQLGQPAKKSLASTALSRLCKQGAVERRRIGRYLLSSATPFNFPEEAVSTEATR
jgi:hypothetical protein